MGPDIYVIGRMRHHLDDVAVHRFGMDCAVTLHVVFRIAGSSSKCDGRGAVVENGFQDIAVESEVDVARAFQDSQNEVPFLDGVVGVSCRVDGLGIHSHERVGGKQLADGIEVDGTETVVIYSEVDAVVKTADPVEIIFVPNDQGVVVYICSHFFDEVLGTGEFQVWMTVMHQFDIHVVEHGHDGKRLVDVTVFSDWFAIDEQRVQFAA